MRIINHTLENALGIYTKILFSQDSCRTTFNRVNEYSQANWVFLVFYSPVHSVSVTSENYKNTEEDIGCMSILNRETTFTTSTLTASPTTNFITNTSALHLA